MKVALISTVYNEEASVARWAQGLRAQTLHPDEFVIVDGGSKDRTVDEMRKHFSGPGFPEPRIIVQRCNIAQGRNIAIKNTTADVIASIDGGSVADPKWLEEIVKPLRTNADVSVVGGWCPMVIENEVHRKIDRLANLTQNHTPVGAHFKPSSRNVAFRREAWEGVGGYPEWLTLTAEDLLFNENLEYAGYKFFYQPSAIVGWDSRPDMGSFLRLMRSYGFGCGEARFAGKIHARRAVYVLCPSLFLLKGVPLRDIPFRTACNFQNVRGWIEGCFKGRKPPAGWQRIGKRWLSPEAIATAQKKQYSAPLDRA